MFEYKPQSRISSKKAISCSLCSLYYLSTKRNAYQNSWSVKYRGRSAFYKDLGLAQHFAEEQRTQGSRFYIRQLPALVFAIGPGSSVLVVVEINTDTPFLDFYPELPETPQISKIAEFFYSRHPDTTHRMITGGGLQLITPTLLFESSRPLQGSKEPLAWLSEKKDEMDIDLHFAKKVSNNLNAFCSGIKGSNG